MGCLYNAKEDGQEGEGAHVPGDRAVWEQTNGLTANLAVFRVPERMPGWVEGAPGGRGAAADSSLHCSYGQE